MGNVLMAFIHVDVEQNMNKIVTFWEIITINKADIFMALPFEILWIVLK